MESSRTEILFIRFESERTEKITINIGQNNICQKTNITEYSSKSLNACQKYIYVNISAVVKHSNYKGNYQPAQNLRELSSFHFLVNKIEFVCDSEYIQDRYKG